MADSDAEFPTTLGPDASFKGQLSFEKGARLLGTFEGEVTTKGHFLIAEKAKLTGEVRAGDIRLEGQVHGNLKADAKVKLAATGRLEGDIEAAQLEVAEGAVLIGRCMVGAKSDGRAAGAVTKTASAPVEHVKPKPKPQPALGEAAKK